MHLNSLVLPPEDKALGLAAKLEKLQYLHN